MRFVRGVALTLFAMVLSLVLAQPARAQQNQSDANSGIGVGGLFMLAFPSIEGLEEEGLEAKTAWGAGLWVGGNKGGTVGFTGEFIYRVNKIENSAGTVVADRKALQIPAVFHINFGKRTKNGAMGYALVGPVFTINVKENLSGGLAGENFAGADIGLLAGGGFEVARVGVELRGNWGFRTITPDNDGALEEKKDKGVELLFKVRFN